MRFYFFATIYTKQNSLKGVKFVGKGFFFCTYKKDIYKQNLTL